MTKKRVSIPLEESDIDTLKDFSKKNQSTLAETCRTMIRETILRRAVDEFSRASMVEKRIERHLIYIEELLKVMARK